MINPSYKHRRILAITRRRFFTDSVSWFVFFLLTIGFCTIYLWYLFDTGRAGQEFDSFIEYVLGRSLQIDESNSWIGAFIVIVRASLAYTFLMMFPVYVNLLILKKYTLDQIKHRMGSYGMYLFSVIANAFLFASMLFLIFKMYPDTFKVKIGFPINLLSILGVQLIATGLVYRREVLNLYAVLGKYKFRIDQKKNELRELKRILGTYQATLAKNHIKIGTKYEFKILQHDDLLYIKGDGNEPRFFTLDRLEGYRGTESMYFYENILPESRFMRVHKSYMVAIEKVIGRRI